MSFLVVSIHPTESEASVRSPKWVVEASILLHPRPGEEMRCFQERRGVGIGLRLSDRRVEVDVYKRQGLTHVENGQRR